MQYQVNDPVGLTGQYVIVSISSDYRVFQITTSVLGSPTGPMQIWFDSYMTEADINNLLSKLP